MMVNKVTRNRQDGKAVKSGEDEQMNKKLPRKLLLLVLGFAAVVGMSLGVVVALFFPPPGFPGLAEIRSLIELRQIFKKGVVCCIPK